MHDLQIGLDGFAPLDPGHNVVALVLLARGNLVVAQRTHVGLFFQFLVNHGLGETAGLGDRVAYFGEDDAVDAFEQFALKDAVATVAFQNLLNVHIENLLFELLGEFANVAVDPGLVRDEGHGARQDEEDLRQGQALFAVGHVLQQHFLVDVLGLGLADAIEGVEPLGRMGGDRCDHVDVGAADVIVLPLFAQIVERREFLGEPRLGQSEPFHGFGFQFAATVLGCVKEDRVQKVLLEKGANRLVKGIVNGLVVLVLVEHDAGAVENVVHVLQLFGVVLVRGVQLVDDEIVVADLGLVLHRQVAEEATLVRVRLQRRNVGAREGELIVEEMERRRETVHAVEDFLRAFFVVLHGPDRIHGAANENRLDEARLEFVVPTLVGAVEGRLYVDVNLVGGQCRFALAAQVHNLERYVLLHVWLVGGCYSMCVFV